jgi:hypothetical protein
LFLGRLTSEQAQLHYDRYVGPYVTSDCRVDLNVAQHVVDAVATELGIPAATVAEQTVDQMYLPACDRAATLTNDGDDDLIRRGPAMSLLGPRRKFPAGAE